MQRQVTYIKNKKSHTCEEGGAYFRISFWHLFMKLRNKTTFEKQLENC